MIYWAPLLHFYQPPTQVYWVLKKICDESYRPLIRLFNEVPNAKVTVNICASLTDLLIEHGMSDVIDGLKDLAARGRIEFVGSAKYHPILPLIPQEEVMRQIVLNHNTNCACFGGVYAPSGFFPPEMCYSHDIVESIMETGHRWIILSGIACPVAWPQSVIHRVSVDGQSIQVVFRDDILSNKISFREVDAKGFITHLRQLSEGQEDIYVVTAMDAETFGHHIKKWETLFLGEVYEEIVHMEPVKKGIRQLRRLVDEQKEIFHSSDSLKEADIGVVTISQLMQLFPAGESIEPHSSSWSTSGDDITEGNPYPLWKSKYNSIHQLLWEHMNIVMELAYKAMEVADCDSARHYADIARSTLDKALHSDQFWWANSDYRFDANMVNRGLVQQREVVYNAYKAIRLSNAGEAVKTEFYYRVIASRDLRSSIMDHLFLK